MDSINNKEDIIKLFTSSKINTISENLKNMIQQNKMLSDQKVKKYLKQFYKYFLEYIIYDVQNKNLNELLKSFSEQLNDLGLIFQTETNEFFQRNINEFKNLERGEVLNLLHLTIYMTNNLNQTNQILSNLITNLNKTLASIDVDLNDNTKDFEYKIKLIKLGRILLTNLKSYNPFLINQIESMLKIFLDSSNRVDNNIRALLETINDLIEIEDINTDKIFTRILDMISDNIFENEQITQNIMKNYIDKCNKLKLKKSIQINFLTIKRKPIQELEPEIDGERRDMTKILEEKLKKTKKQAIRSIKKEARVIDTQRQNVLKKMDAKRKEEMKASNQFIEQTNIDYKKLVTSQSKKRFKLKHNKK
jgi:hypothetical protein